MEIACALPRGASCEALRAPQSDSCRVYRNCRSSQMRLSTAVGYSRPSQRDHRITSVAYMAIVRPMSAGLSCPASSTGSLPRSRKYWT